MISNKAKYAFRALLAVAAQPRDEPITSADIARRHAIPHKFLEQILLDLKKAGILDSRRGKSGGYVMLRPADTVSFAEILRLIDGPLAPLPCLSRYNCRPCDDCETESTCEIRREFARAHEASRQVLETRTIADALAGPKVEVASAAESRAAR